MTKLEEALLAEIAPSTMAIDDARWLAPMDFGGSNGSGHAMRATRMAQKGWLERRYRGHEPGQALRRGARGSCLYRITALGLQALHNHRALSRRRVAA